MEVNYLPELQKSKKLNSFSISRVESPSKLNWRRGFTFGQGKRSPMVNAKGRNSPPPGSYNIQSIFDKGSNGPLLRGQVNDEHSVKRVRNLPGPGSYDPYLPLGQNAPKFSLRPRINLKIRSKSPGPSNYYPNFKTTQSTRFSAIGFGIGEKEKKHKKISPGPGSYEIPSIFSNTLIDFPIPR
jgi:Sperm-tail PG-rich repeat